MKAIRIMYVVSLFSEHQIILMTFIPNGLGAIYALKLVMILLIANDRLHFEIKPKTCHVLLICCEKY